MMTQPLHRDGFVRDSFEGVIKKKKGKKTHSCESMLFPPKGNSVMTLREQCPQAFQEGYKVLAGSHIGADREDKRFTPRWSKSGE